MHLYNIKSRNISVLCHWFKVFMGTCYLGGYIRDDELKRDWLKNCRETWERNVFTISKTAGKYLQESYSAVVSGVQLEWIFLQPATKNMGDAFTGVENMIWENVLPYFFLIKSKSLSPILRTPSIMTAKRKLFFISVKPPPPHPH